MPPPLSAIGAPPQDTDLLQGTKASAVWLAWFRTLLKAGLKNVANTWEAVQTMPAAVFTAPEQVQFGAGWQNWAATAAPGAPMTMTIPALNDAQFIRIGPLLYFKLDFQATLGGTLTGLITFTLPVPLAGQNSVLCASILQGGNWSRAFSYVNPTGLIVSPDGGATYAAGAWRAIVSGFYRCA